MSRGVRSALVLLAIVLSGTIPSIPGTQCQAQAASSAPMPQLVKKDGRYALIVDGAPYLMLGGQVNNSSAWPAELPLVWPTIEKLHANTVEMPITWEQFEPEPGHFDDSVLHVLLDQARQHNVHLVLLWFGTWKNGNPHCTPAWLRTDNNRYPRMVDPYGRTLDSLSPFGEATLEADKRAFRMLMRDLKADDPQHTVLMVQVENESGVVGGIRDFSAAAQKLFHGPVPAALVQALGKQPGTWSQVFGEDADESFGAWAIAHYINQVAAAGKAENPLPTYVNVWIRDPIYYQPPGDYDTGGATDNMLPIWKATANSIDVIGPDIYRDDYARYERVLELYDRPDNAMFVPETGRTPIYARYFFAALGKGTIGFSPFGMDEVEDEDSPLHPNPEFLSELSAIYQAFAPMDREIAKLNFEGKIKAVAQDPATAEQTLTFGRWKALISWQLTTWGSKEASSDGPRGGALIAQLGPDEFLVTAVHARVDFELADRSSPRQFVRVEEGAYQDGTWHLFRLWNGDQTDFGLNFPTRPRVLKVRVGTY